MNKTSDKEKKFISIKIPAQLYERIEKRVNETDFPSVSDYVAYVLREVLASLDEDYEVFTEEEEEKIKERLRSLGYLD